MIKIKYASIKTETYEVSGAVIDREIDPITHFELKQSNPLNKIINSKNPYILLYIIILFIIYYNNNYYYYY